MSQFTAKVHNLKLFEAISFFKIMQVVELQYCEKDLLDFFFRFLLHLNFLDQTKF